MPLISLGKKIIDGDIHHAERIYVAYSGGIDSHVLLHLCATDPHLKTKSTAVYVNHGLQAEADDWEKHCRSVCEALRVKFLPIRVNATAAPGESPEEAARNARYAALKPLLQENDVLLLAHHADDQLETVLLQLFRGGGLPGLSGMPERKVFGNGLMLRPLLGVAKQEIDAYAESHRLKWIADASNLENRYDRNFLRNTVLPLVKKRWPALDITVSRAAQHCAEAQGIVNLFAENLFQTVVKPDGRLIVDVLKTYPFSQQQLIIRQWFRHLDLKMPSQRAVQQILLEIVQAKAGANPCLITQGREIRRYQNALYCITPERLTNTNVLIWPKNERTIKLAENLTYRIELSTRGIPEALWQNSEVTVGWRKGGERIRLPGRDGSHSLKNLFQEAGIPPWQRSQVPLIFLDGQLAAVGEYWVDGAFYTESNPACLRIVAGK